MRSQDVRLKFLQPDKTSPYRSTLYEVPTLREDGTYEPTAWTTPVRIKPRVCEYGYHLATLRGAAQWYYINTDCYLAEGKGRSVESKLKNKQAYESVRLIRPLPKWKDATPQEQVAFMLDLIALFDGTEAVKATSVANTRTWLEEHKGDGDFNKISSPLPMYWRDDSKGKGLARLLTSALCDSLYSYTNGMRHIGNGIQRLCESRHSAMVPIKPKILDLFARSLGIEIDSE